MIDAEFSQRKTGISGYVVIRNAVELDYCVVEAVKSLLPICNEVVVADGESTDATAELVKAIGDSRIRILSYPWPNPHRAIHFFTDWLNWTRERLDYSYQITVDGDEVLCPSSYDMVIRLYQENKCGIFERLNFWKDAQHLAPRNRVCGDTVARCGPSDLFCCSDEPYPRVNPNLRTNAEPFPSLRIFHYGFLRKPDAFVKKADAIQNMFFGSTDSRLTEQVAKGERWDARDYFPGERLRPFEGQHPEVARAWLTERGYSL